MLSPQLNKTKNQPPDTLPLKANSEESAGHPISCCVWFEGENGHFAFQLKQGTVLVCGPDYYKIIIFYYILWHFKFCSLNCCSTMTQLLVYPIFRKKQLVSQGKGGGRPRLGGITGIGHLIATGFRKSLPWKINSNQLKSTTRIENHLKGHKQKVIRNWGRHLWGTVGSRFSLLLFNAFINALEEGVNHPLMNLAEDGKWGGVLECRTGREN